MSLFCVSQSIIARGLIKNSGVAIRDGILAEFASNATFDDLSIRY